MAEKERPANVILLPAHDNMTAEQAIDYAQHEAHTLDDVLIVGCTKGGELYLRSSHMKREWALWLATELADYIRGVGRHSS